MGSNPAEASQTSEATALAWAASSGSEKRSVSTTSNPTSSPSSPSKVRGRVREFFSIRLRAVLRAMVKIQLLKLVPFWRPPSAFIALRNESWATSAASSRFRIMRATKS
ncbi:hypothetical protein [Candidatus Amarobacter glycogenicus]|uniref:hypothetical protein n=1 Tax=Candidatus Amarobacter glycogenicus TaxID=3140699 RepID=UPI0031CC91D1